ncbi:unnamed protein product, partial [Allacma fusca]
HVYKEGFPENLDHELMDDIV